MRLGGAGLVLWCLIAVVPSGHQNPHKLPEDFADCTGIFKAGQEWVGQVGDNACYKLLMTVDGLKRLKLKKKEAQNKCENGSAQDGSSIVQGHLPLLRTPAQREAFFKLVQVSGKGTYWIGIERITEHEYQWDDGEKVGVAKEQQDWMWWWADFYPYHQYPYVVMKHQIQSSKGLHPQMNHSTFVYCQKLIKLNLTLSNITTTMTDRLYASRTMTSTAGAASYKPTSTQAVVPGVTDPTAAEPSAREGQSDRNVAIYAVIGVGFAILLTISVIIFITVVYWGKRNTATDEHHLNSPGHYYQPSSISATTADAGTFPTDTA